MLDFNSTSHLGDRVNWFIDQAALGHAQQEPVRTYLGLSYLGGECARQVQYMFLAQQADAVAVAQGLPRPVKFSAQTLRRFERGHTGETMAIAWLRRAGFALLSEDPATGRQWRVDLLGDGQVLGHADGILSGFYSRHGLAPFELPALWECKVLESKRARAIRKEGLRRAEPRYFAQVQGYMGGLGLQRCLFTVVNADTMELDHYQIEFIPQEFVLLQGRARMILHACAAGEFAPRGMSKSTDFRCRMCEHAGVCWNG